MKGCTSTDDPDAFGRRLILRWSPGLATSRDDPPLTLRPLPTPAAPIRPVRTAPMGPPEEREDLASLLADEILLRMRREMDVEAERGGMT